ncbi:MAG: hypothetical protein HQK83_11315 [Fibrobacteria bacterium]|nr:hypothetical protein [Fibrobacteria bacterium]
MKRLYIIRYLIPILLISPLWAVVSFNALFSEYGSDGVPDHQFNCVAFGDYNNDGGFDFFVVKNMLLSPGKNTNFCMYRNSGVLSYTLSLANETGTSENLFDV